MTGAADWSGVAKRESWGAPPKNGEPPLIRHAIRVRVDKRTERTKLRREIAYAERVFMPLAFRQLQRQAPKTPPKPRRAKPQKLAPDTLPGIGRMTREQFSRHCREGLLRAVEPINRAHRDALLEAVVTLTQELGRPPETGEVYARYLETRLPIVARHVGHRSILNHLRALVNEGRLAGTLISRGRDGRTTLWEVAKRGRP